MSEVLVTEMLTRVWTAVLTASDSRTQRIHAEPIALAADTMALALCEIGSLAERRIAMGERRNRRAVVLAGAGGRAARAVCGAACRSARILYRIASRSIIDLSMMPNSA
ncbi:MAG: hypothetical protein HC793_04960 [Aquincola sp.]|nr:hypothetical protein [Aquincola sp.]